MSHAETAETARATGGTGQPGAGTPAVAGNERTRPSLAAAAQAPTRRRGAFGRLLRSELDLVLGRRRNQLLLALLASVPILLGIVLAIVSDSAYAGQGPGFIDRIGGNGLFLVVTSLFLCTPFLLPLVTSIAAGDAIAGEAGGGTLRYLLTVPVRRGTLLVAKALAAMTFMLVAVALVTAAALLAGGVLFGFNDLTLLSGQTIPLTDGVLRMLGVAAYVAMSLAGLVAVGLFFSTLAEVPVGVMAATVVVAIVSTVLDSLPQLSAIHPFLLTHHWFDFAEFLRFEVSWSLLGQGLALQAAWVAIFGSLAWARFTTADITS